MRLTLAMEGKEATQRSAQKTKPRALSKSYIPNEALQWISPGWAVELMHGAKLKIASSRLLLAGWRPSLLGWRPSLVGGGHCC